MVNLSGSAVKAYEPHVSVDVICYPRWLFHTLQYALMEFHDDVIKRKHFPLYWPFVRGIDRSPVNSPRKGQWRRALIFPLVRA